MTLTEFLLASQNLPFAIALGVFALLALIEVASLIFGGSTGSVDQDLGLDAGGEGLDAGGSFDFLQWLHFGTIPTLIYMIICLLGFGIAGYAIQWAMVELGMPMLHMAVASILAIMAMIPWIRGTGNILKKTLLKDETDVVSSDALLGSLATITLGKTSFGNATQAKVTDKFGQVHYVLVEPLLESASYQTGEEVVLMERHGATFKVIGREDSFSDITDQLMDQMGELK